MHGSSADVAVTDDGESATAGRKAWTYSNVGVLASSATALEFARLPGDDCAAGPHALAVRVVVCHARLKSTYTFCFVRARRCRQCRLPLAPSGVLRRCDHLQRRLPAAAKTRRHPTRHASSKCFEHARIKCVGESQSCMVHSTMACSGAADGCATKARCWGSVSRHAVRAYKHQLM